jgi:hypothetical protein
MNGDLRRAGWAGAWMALTLSALTACNAAPATTGNSTANLAATRSVVDDVRLATDRAAAQRDVVTLPNGERTRRVSLENGFSHVVVGKMGPDGKPSVTCVDNAPAAESFLAGNKQGSGQ